MAFYPDVVLNPATGRHEVEFVNQQKDLLMAIRWDEAAKDYVLDVSEEEAYRIGKSWNAAPFKVAELLEFARKVLPERDQKLKKDA